MPESSVNCISAGVARLLRAALLQPLHDVPVDLAVEQELAGGARVAQAAPPSHRLGSPRRESCTWRA